MDNREYKRTHSVNKERFSELLLAAKGNRSLTEFAAECNTFPSTFTRILQGANKGGSSIELLQEIASHAVPESQVTLEMLADANGYTITTRANLVGSEFEYAVQSALVKTLLRKGANVSVSWPRFLPDSSKYFSPDFLITTDAFGDKTSNWYIKAISYRGSNSLRNRSPIFCKVLEYLAVFSIVNASTKELPTHPSYYSIVVDSKPTYDIIYKEFHNITVYDNVSILLIDPNTHSIEAEFLLPNIDTGHRAPFFMTKMP